MTKYASRKFGFAVATLVTACGFLIADKLTGSEWVTVTIFILGMYKAANVVEHKNDAS